ncbi:F-box protein CPR1 [Bienertia sinuspersici]
MKFGFGFDSFNDDYKVVVIVDSDIVVDHLFPDDVDVANEITREVFVYSMNFKSWRLIEGTSSSRDGVLSGENGVLINTHLLHWVFQSSDSHENRIGCFDLRTDKWVQDVPLPNYYKNHGTNWCNFYDDKKINVVHIGVLDKCLCLLTDNPSNVWIMKEYGVKESWVKLLGVSDSQITQSLKFCPLAYRGVASNEVLVRKINQRKKASELVWYNVHEKKFQRVDQIFKSRKVYGFLDAYVCEGSLVDLPGGLKL